MATDFTQDAVLHFLQSSGGSVKNSDLLLHFRYFLRDHADRSRNRDLFKKFVNSVATVKQEQGVSYVILKKKFKGHVPGGGGVGSSGPRRLPAGRSTESSPESGCPNKAGSREQPRLKQQLREETTPAPLGDTAKKTILPAAGIMLNNNNNLETNLNLKQQQQVISTPKSARPAAAQVVSHSQIPEKTETKTPSLPEPPTRDQRPKAGQNRVGFALPPGITPAVRHHGATSKQVPVPETPRGREAIQQPEGGLHQDPALHHISLQSQVTPRRARCRKSYKSAVSHDEYEEEEEEEVPMRRGSAGALWPLSTPLGHSERVLSASSPCIIDPPAPPSVVSSSSSSERKPPKIYIQDVEGETLPPRGPGWSLESGAELRGQWAGPGREPASVPGDTMSTRRSLPLEAERHTPSLDRAEEVALHGSMRPDHRYTQPAGVQLEARQGLSQSQTARLSSSQGSILSPPSDASFSSDWPSSDSPRGSDWNSSYEDLQARAGETVGVAKIQEVLQRAQAPKPESVMHHADSKTTTPWHPSTGNLHNDQKPTVCVSPLRHSTDNLHDNQQSTPYGLPWDGSTGDLHHDAEGAESSEGSTCSPPVRLRPAVAKRLSSKLRSRMCRSLGANLDHLLEEEEERRGGGRGGSEAARLNRLHLISSSLSLHCNLSSSSLSSCSTPPRCHSLADLAEDGERKGGRRSLPAGTSSSGAPHVRQSLVPLEPKEHVWLVKGAEGIWPDIYSLFREDSSLLNRRDFISGFTVLHWIAKHGDHRVLNTLWYGVQKAGLTFDINARSSGGYTPLHIAAIHGNKNIMRLLVKKFSADVKLRDTAGKRPWQYLSRTAPPDIFQLLGAPARASLGEGAGAGNSSLEQQQHRRRRRHHLSSASSGERPLTIAGLTKVKRSSSFAAFLKHKTLRRLHGHQSDSSV
ncbi:ankyrin repeat domain-containing protein SOWAHB-like [Thunnus thynnus]|uniref:ankyrin repeat domain-containing protein SOWAHB-like n=1 Tax=Thunnus thynnus TaxID=8237 RepID=UPI003528A6F9